LQVVAPGEEFGRNDTAKLGSFIVKVFTGRHEIVPIRTYGEISIHPETTDKDLLLLTDCKVWMLGVSLRQGWGRRVELAVDGLDEFKRKETYRDGLLIALLELGVTSLRVPLADLANADVRRRLSDFVRLGFGFTVYSLDSPDEHVLTTIAAHGALLENWEFIFPEHSILWATESVRIAQSVFKGKLFISPVVPLKKDVADKNIFQHFASHGFSVEQTVKAKKLLSTVNDNSHRVGLTFRVSPWDDHLTTLSEIDRQVKDHKLINLQMPRLNEGKCFDDEKKLVKFIIDVYKTSRTMQNSTVFLDTFVDNDRGYYPRIGLLDRRLNPRKAFHALKSVSQQLSQQI